MRTSGARLLGHGGLAVVLALSIVLVPLPGSQTRPPAAWADEPSVSAVLISIAVAIADLLGGPSWVPEDPPQPAPQGLSEGAVAAVGQGIPLTVTAQTVSAAGAVRTTTTTKYASTGGAAEVAVPAEVPGPRGLPEGYDMFESARVSVTRDGRVVVSSENMGCRAAVVDRRVGGLNQVDYIPSVKYSLTHTARFELVRPPGAAERQDQVRLPLTVSSLNMNTVDQANTTGKVGFEWKVTSPELGTLFQSDVTVPQGGTAAVGGSIPASAFDLSTPGQASLAEYGRELVVPVAAGLSRINFVVELTVRGEGALAGVPSALSPPDAWEAPPLDSRDAPSDDWPVVLRWVQPAFARQFHIQVTPLFGDGPGIDLIIGAPAQVAAAQYTVRQPSLGAGNYTILPGSEYGWRVRVSAAAVPVGAEHPSWEPWMPPQVFRVPRPSAASITLAQPAPGSSTSDSTPRLVWQDANTEVFYYEIQLSSDPDFGTGPQGPFAAVQWQLRHGGLVSPVNSYTSPVELTPGTYYWRVRPRVQATDLGVVEPGVPWTGVARFLVR